MKVQGETERHKEMSMRKVYDIHGSTHHNESYFLYANVFKIKYSIQLRVFVMQMLYNDHSAYLTAI